MSSHAPSDDAPCGCGHEHRAHQHYRRGNDCALCACARFRVVLAPAGADGRLPRWLRRLRGAAT